MGVKVAGPLARVAELAERFNASQAIIAMPGEAHAFRGAPSNCATPLH